jgi:hypothetical protein
MCLTWRREQLHRITRCGADQNQVPCHFWPRLSHACYASRWWASGLEWAVTCATWARQPPPWHRAAFQVAQAVQPPSLHHEAPWGVSPGLNDPSTVAQNPTIQVFKSQKEREDSNSACVPVCFTNDQQLGMCPSANVRRMTSSRDVHRDGRSLCRPSLVARQRTHSTPAALWPTT